MNKLDSSIKIKGFVKWSRKYLKHFYDFKNQDPPTLHTIRDIYQSFSDEVGNKTRLNPGIEEDNSIKARTPAESQCYFIQLEL